MEMVFVDEKGHKIGAVVKHGEFEKRKDQLKEGCTYIMQNFEVEANSGEYKVSKHPFQLIFMKGTTVRECNLSQIPERVYKFTSFEDILSGKAPPDVLVDVIGQFVEIKRERVRSTSKKMVNVLLKDNRGITLSVTLWDTYADQLLSFLDNNEAGLIIVILTLAKIRDTKGQYPISIQNSKYGSKLLINEDSEEINRYKSSLESLLICDSLSQGISQVPSYSQTSTGEWFFTNTQVMSLKEINKLDMETYCVTVAKIDKFLVANGWSYDACMYCTKGGDPKETPYLCPGCKKTISETVARFRLEVQVSQGSEVAKFVLWDDVCVQLLNVTAAKLMQLMIDKEELDPMVVPVTIDSILGRTLAFNIKVQPKYKRSSVTKVSEDAVIMESIINKLAVDEVAITINSDNGKSVLNEDDYFDSLCMSATADYDPDSLGNQTPAKRLSSEEQFDDQHNQHLTTCQLSTTKMRKNIKTE
ncbi:hypothetical protein SESBI_27564 [Sesbania bispinosa]|nr:hypothetical protein SESBI_27564 [Sesbania bispinosa]